MPRAKDTSLTTRAAAFRMRVVTAEDVEAYIKIQFEEFTERLALLEMTKGEVYWLIMGALNAFRAAGIITEDMKYDLRMEYTKKILNRTSGAPKKRRLIGNEDRNRQK